MIVNGLCSAAESCRVELSRPRQAQRIAKPASELPPETEETSVSIGSRSLCDSARRLSLSRPLPARAGHVGDVQAARRREAGWLVGIPGCRCRSADVVLDRSERSVVWCRVVACLCSQAAAGCPVACCIVRGAALQLQSALEESEDRIAELSEKIRVVSVRCNMKRCITPPLATCSTQQELRCAQRAGPGAIHSHHTPQLRARTHCRASCGLRTKRQNRRTRKPAKCAPWLRKLRSGSFQVDSRFRGVAVARTLLPRCDADKAGGA